MIDYQSARRTEWQRKPKIAGDMNTRYGYSTLNRRCNDGVAVGHATFIHRSSCDKGVIQWAIGSMSLGGREAVAFTPVPIIVTKDRDIRAI